LIEVRGEMITSLSNLVRQAGESQIETIMELNKELNK